MNVKKVAWIIIPSILLSFSLCACAAAVDRSQDQSSTNGNGIDSEKASEVDAEKSMPQELLSKAESESDDLLNSVGEIIEERENATPIYAKLGEEVQATPNLAVSVLEVESGPYDYLDKTDTVEVTVSMKNTSSSTIWVKASNWDADTSNGTRVDHKNWIFGKDFKKEASSFGVKCLYPGGTFTGTLYFDAEDLVAVLYEPHWLISSENEYIYWLLR